MHLGRDRVTNSVETESYSMQKIIGHARFERATTPYAYSIRVHELGDHHEALAIPRYAWAEINPLSVAAQAFYDEAASGKVWDHATGDWVPAPPDAASS